MGPNNKHEIKYLTKVENRLPEFYASELLASKGYGVCLYSELEGDQIRLDWFDTKQTTADLLCTYNQLISLKHGLTTRCYKLHKTNSSKTIIQDVTWKLDASLNQAKAIKNNYIMT